MQTAKTIQLRDKSENYISPATNIESLYYEQMGTDDQQNIIYRHTVSPYFPVYVNYGSNKITESQCVVNASNVSILDISTRYSKIVDKNTDDIIISNFVQRRLTGTNYYALDVCTYNLSKILQSYVGISYLDVSANEIKGLINNAFAKNKQTNNEQYIAANASIFDISTRTSKAEDNINLIINDISTLNDINTYSYEELKQLKSSNILIAGALYRMEYDPSKGGGALESFASQIHIFDIVLLALNNTTFDTDIVACLPNKSGTSNYFENTNMSLWQVKYDFDTNKITWMKDEFGNEAPYDFKNRMIKKNGDQSQETYLFVDENNNDYSLCSSCHDNIVKTDTVMITFNVSSGTELAYNLIGIDTIDVYIKNDNNSITSVCHNIVGNRNNGVCIINASHNTIGCDLLNCSVVGSYNNIGNNNVSTKIIGDNNIVKAGCNNIEIGYAARYTSGRIGYLKSDYNIIEVNNSSIKICQGSYNNIFELNCYNCLIGKNDTRKTYNNLYNITVGQYYQDGRFNSSNAFYTYQKIYARDFEKIN